MPTYQYACTACDERLEVVQRFTDDPLTECPACAGTLRKVFSPVGVVFKGSGFYKTDSRKSSPSSSSTTPSTDAKPADSTPASSSPAPSSSASSSSSDSSSSGSSSGSGAAAAS